MAVVIDGSNTPTAGGVIYGDGTEYAATSAGTSGQALLSAGSSAPTWGTPASATTATNLAGGSAGTVPYQSASGTTAMLAAGTSGQLLQSNGAAAPSWVAAPSATAATQAQMEAVTSNTVFATPFNTQFHPGVAKVWFKVGSLFNSGVIMAAYNVTSVVDGTGALTVTIGTDFSTDNYAVVATPEYSQPNPSADKLTVGVQRGSMAAGSFQLLCVNYTNTLFDPDYYLCAAFGDQ